MLNVTIVCSSLVRQGPTNVLYNMLSAYSHLDTDVKYRILTLSPEQETSRKEEFENLGIRVDSLNLQPGYKTAKSLKLIKEGIMETEPDICQTSGFRTDLLVSFIQLPGVKKISALWNYPYEDYRPDYGYVKGSLMAFLHLIRLRRFDRVIPCSCFIEEQVKKYGLKTTTIHTGVPMDYFSPLTLEERLARRIELDIPQDAKVFIFIANLIPRKNPEILIRAFRRVENANALLLVMGDGPLYDNCKNLNHENPNVRFLGRQPGTLKYLQVSDFYISPSFSEGFPTAVLEAMSVGITPVLSNIRPHMEMLNGVSYGISFSPDNEEELVNSINRSLDYVSAFDYRKYMEENFSDKLMFRRFEAVYNDLLRSSAAQNS